MSTATLTGYTWVWEVVQLWNIRLGPFTLISPEKQNWEMAHNTNGLLHWNITISASLANTVYSTHSRRHDYKSVLLHT